MSSSNDQGRDYEIAIPGAAIEANNGLRHQGTVMAA
jgi:hypothetical protein